MQKVTAIAIVLGALIVAASLIYHGQQLASVARQMEALEQRTGELDSRLNAFSVELPSLIEQAGRGAGRQAVQGVFEEAFHKPLGKAAAQISHATSTITRAATPLEVQGLLPAEGTPWIRFDIPEPVVNIEILTQIKDLPSFPELSHTNNPQAGDGTNRTLHTQQVPVVAEEGR